MKKFNKKYGSILSVALFFPFFGMNANTNDGDQKPASLEKQSINKKLVEIIITKNTTREELDNLKKSLTDQGFNFDYSGLKYNDLNEIIAIKITYSNGKNKGTLGTSGHKPIDKIVIKTEGNKISVQSSGSNNSSIIQQGGDYEMVDEETSQKEMKEKMDARREEMRTRMDEKRAEMTERSNEMRENMTQRSTEMRDKMKTMRENNETYKNGINYDTSYSNFVEKDEAMKIASSNNKPLIITKTSKEITEAEMSAMDPNGIESINILKDDSATQLYGDKGKNGVIIITLKE